MSRTTPSRRQSQRTAQVVPIEDLKERHNLELRDLRQDLSNALNNQELLRESLADLELAIEDTGWERLSTFGQREFSILGLRRIRQMARLSFLKNPLIRHAVLVQSHYVWGQGCTVAAEDDLVNTVVQKFLDDPKNVIAFSGHVARTLLENELQVEGDLFFAMFTNRNTGRVVMRRLHADEIPDIVSNPEDYMEPWYYHRKWTEQTFDIDGNSGETRAQMKEAYYPDWRLIYNNDPETPKPSTINGHEVMWDAPVYHLKVGGFGDQKFGCPEVYSALDWARAVKEDLEDYATIRRAHSRFAFKQTTKGGRAGVAAGKTKLGTTLNAGGTGGLESNPAPVAGSVYVSSEGWDLSPMKTAGMTPSPEEGKRLWLMVSAGTGIPETILAGNADVGNLATAKTLDRPTELQMENRRILWADTYTDILNYVIDMAIKAPSGALSDEGEEEEDEEGLVAYTLTSRSRDVEVRFPSILRHDVLPMVQAIVQATTLNNGQTAGLLDDRTIASLLLKELGVDDYDDIVAAMFPGGTLTTNAGRMAPAGLEKPDGEAQPLPGEESSTDAGLGDMGDGSNNLPNAADVSTALNYGLVAARRKRLRGGSRLIEQRKKTTKEVPA